MVQKQNKNKREKRETDWQKQRKRQKQFLSDKNIKTNKVLITMSLIASILACKRR